MLTEEHFQHIQDRRLRSLVGHWLDIREGQTMPRRGSIDPAAIRAVLAHLVLYEYLSDAKRFRCRLIGEEAQALLCNQIRSRQLSDFSGNLRLLELALKEVVERQAVLHGIGTLQFGDSVTPGEALILPFSDDGAQVDAILHAVFTEAPRRQPDQAITAAVDMIDTLTPVVPAPGAAEIVPLRYRNRLVENDGNGNVALRRDRI